MNFVIGDIHGEFTKLKKLIENILALEKDPTLIFIGDYTNKGEDPYQTLKLLAALQQEKECIFLRGNHEYFWEALTSDSGKDAEALMKYGAQNTISSIGGNPGLCEAKELLYSEFPALLTNLRSYYLSDNYVITHSGIPPSEYENELDKIPADKFLFNRYDFISLQKLYLNRKIIFGHTGFYSPFYDGYKIGIDTAACYLEDQPLTSFCTSDDFFLNSANRITRLSEIDQSFCPAIPRVKAWRQK
ncbi:MAG: serine/threonine protein phosphatase [Bacteroidetes bacterium]|nr:serine/threonine protein phosphatase [Bacteroidota bacterium]